MGLLLEVLVHEASTQDRDGARPLLQRVVATIQTVLLVYLDSAYQGELLSWMEQTLGLKAEVIVRCRVGTPTDKPVSRANNAPFPILPRRWVVERTLAWLSRCRRLAKDYEASIEASEAMLWFASLRTLTRRLAGAT